MHRHEEILPQEEIQVRRREIVRLRRAFVEADDGHHDEDVAGILLELDPCPGREGVFDGQGVELEHFFEQRVLVHVRAVDVHPQLAFARLKDFADAGGGNVLLERAIGPPVEAGRPILRGLRLLRRYGSGGYLPQKRAAPKAPHPPPAGRAAKPPPPPRPPAAGPAPPPAPPPPRR